MASQRPYSTLHSPDDGSRHYSQHDQYHQHHHQQQQHQALQASQYSLHTPVDVVSPHSFRTQPPQGGGYPHHGHPGPGPVAIYAPAMDPSQQGYQLSDYPQPQSQPQPQSPAGYVVSPVTPRFSSPPPAFDAPPQVPQSPTFAPPPTIASPHPVPTTTSPIPQPPYPAPVTVPPPTMPQSPKTPLYTPGGGSGPNGGMHAPGQIGHPNQQHGREVYHHGLCDCFSDISTCCLGWWCPCILYSRTYHRLQTSPNSNLNGFSKCNGSCMLFCALGPISWVFTTLQRLRIREKYRLEGSVASDCGKAYCCVMCTLVQDEREVRDREDERRRFAGPGSGIVGDGGYRRQSTMVYGRE